MVPLDTRMPGKDGFALPSGLERRPAVIFVTAHDDLAVRAFDESAVDRLLHPFRRERRAVAIDRIRRSLAGPAASSRRLEGLLGARRGSGRGSTRRGWPRPP